MSYTALIRILLTLPFAWAVISLNPHGDTHLWAQDSEQEEEGGNDIGDGVDDALGDVDDGISDIADDIENTTDDITEGIQDQIDDALGDDGVGDALDGAEDAVDTVGDIQETIGSVQDSIGDALGSIGDQLSDIFSVFDQFTIPNFDNIFSNADEITGNGGGGGSVGDNSSGVLGMPDPSVVEENINQSGTSPTEEALATTTGGDGSEAIRRDAVTAFNADLAEEIARDTAMTEEGQERIAGNLAIIDESLEESQARAEDSQDQRVSQNILRNISVQFGAQQATDSLLSTDAQMRQRDDALRNNVLADDLRLSQEKRVSDRRQDASAYNFAVTHGGLIAIPGLNNSTDSE